MNLSLKGTKMLNALEKMLDDLKKLSDF